MSNQSVDAAASSQETIEGNLSKNIEVFNPLVVNGNITAGLKIVCHSSLTVRENVFASEIVCHGDFIVEKNIELAPGTRIAVKGHIRAAEIKNGDIDCDKGLYVSGNIVDSVIRCRHIVNVSGSIEGGDVAAASSITAGRLGFEGQKADSTKVGAGTNFRLRLMNDEMEKEISEISEKAEKIRVAVKNLQMKEKTHYSGLSHSDKKLLKSTVESLDVFEKQILGLKVRQQKLVKKLEQATSAYIEVTDKIYTGTRLAIQHRYVVAPREYPAGKFTIREDRICRV